MTCVKQLEKNIVFERLKNNYFFLNHNPQEPTLKNQTTAI